MSQGATNKRPEYKEEFKMNYCARYIEIEVETEKGGNEVCRLAQEELDKKIVELQKSLGRGNSRMVSIQEIYYSKCNGAVRKIEARYLTGWEYQGTNTAY